MESPFKLEYFDVLNRVTDRQTKGTDGRTDRLPLAIARSGIDTAKITELKTKLEIKRQEN